MTQRVRRPGVLPRYFLSGCVLLVVIASAARAEVVRIATFGAALSRDGPGLLLRDLGRDDDAQIEATLAIVARIAPDILVLTSIDWDFQGAALATLRDRMAPDYPYVFAGPTNVGVATGLDLDGNGRLGEARDAQGYGRFRGEGGLAVLSRYPLDVAGLLDFSSLLWADLPGGSLADMLAAAPDFAPGDHAQRRLSTSAHWVLAVQTPGGALDLAIWSATPPVFDGPEDANGLRNRDELRLWSLWLDGVAIQGQTRDPTRPFVLIGNANLDPVDGDGYPDAMAALLADRRLQDPAPASAGGRAAADAGQRGDPATDTADWPDDRPGNLRVSYVLPSADLVVTGAGVFWPGPDDPDLALLGDDGLAAGPHRLVWVDVDVGAAPASP